MNILIISNSPVTSLFGKTIPWNGTVCTVTNELVVAEADAVDVLIDLDFENHPDRIAYYQQLNRPTLIGSVLYTLHQLHATAAPVARFNHWPGFLDRTIAEIAVSKQHEHLFQAFFEQLEIPFFITADEPGFVSARTISMIINEAFTAREDHVSTAEEIDIAMKLGTGYPYGPFEWSKRIGVNRIKDLLQILAASDQRYQPTTSLLQYKTSV